MKRAQVITQVFIYIASAAIFLSLLLFGYQFTTHLLQNQDTVVLADFRTSLSTKVDQLRVRRGSVVLDDFRVPSGYNTLCIVDSTGQVPVGLENKYPEFYNAWQSGTENVFLLPKQEIPIHIDNIEIDGGYLCLPINGPIHLRLEGTGRSVKISQ